MESYAYKQKNTRICIAFISMRNLRNEIKNCFIALGTENKQKELAAQLNTWLEKAEEEMHYGDINDAITIALAILEELTSRETDYAERNQSPLDECYQKALDITSRILKIPSTRSDVKLLLEYELEQILRCKELA